MTVQSLPETETLQERLLQRLPRRTSEQQVFPVHEQAEVGWVDGRRSLVYVSGVVDECREGANSTYLLVYNGDALSREKGGFVLSEPRDSPLDQIRTYRRM